MGKIIKNGFYSDKEKKIIRDELFDSEAQTISRKFMSGKWGKITNSQIRKMFDEIKRFQRVRSLASLEWDRKKPMIKLIKSKVNYAMARAKKSNPREKEYYENFRLFILEGIDMINDEKDLDTFIMLFEAVYGFYYAEAEGVRQ